MVDEVNKTKENKSNAVHDKGLYAVMRVLYSHKEMYACQLAKELNLSRARMSSIVKNLKSKKYISLRCPITDRRKMLIKITKEGIDAVKEKYKAIIDNLKFLFEKLGEEKTECMISLMKDIIQIYKENVKGELQQCLD